MNTEKFSILFADWKDIESAEHCLALVLGVYSSEDEQKHTQWVTGSKNRFSLLFDHILSELVKSKVLLMKTHDYETYYKINPEYHISKAMDYL